MLQRVLFLLILLVLAACGGPSRSDEALRHFTINYFARGNDEIAAEDVVLAPGEAPTDIPIPEGARVLGTFDLAVDEPAYWGSVFYHTDLAPDAVYAFYGERLTADDEARQYDTGERTIEVWAYEFDGVTDVEIRLMSGEACTPGCERITPEATIRELAERVFSIRAGAEHYDEDWGLYVRQLPPDMPITLPGQPVVALDRSPHSSTTVLLAANPERVIQSLESQGLTPSDDHEDWWCGDTVAAAVGEGETTGETWVTLQIYYTYVCPDMTEAEDLVPYVELPSPFLVTSGSGGGALNYHKERTFRSDMTIAELDAFYEPILAEAGWQPTDDETVTDDSLRRVYRIVDENGMVWRGTLTLSVEGDHRTVRVAVELDDATQSGDEP